MVTKKNYTPPLITDLDSALSEGKAVKLPTEVTLKVGGTKMGPITSPS